MEVAQHRCFLGSFHHFWLRCLSSVSHLKERLSGQLRAFCFNFSTWDYITESVPLRQLAGSFLSRQLLCVSIGYFIYDSLLSLSRIRLYPGRAEIIAHHVITMATLGLSLFDQPLFRDLMPYCAFGLVIELNNVFIHVRSLLDLAHLRWKCPRIYQLNTACALGKLPVHLLASSSINIRLWSPFLFHRLHCCVSFLASALDQHRGASSASVGANCPASGRPTARPGHRSHFLRYSISNFSRRLSP